MGKRLVKTAKQQFEERLKVLHVFKTWKLCDTEIYYHCTDVNEGFYILRDQDGEYHELRYKPRYEDLILSERFLSSMSERFTSHDVEMKPLFEWYASADHDDEPFNLMDIYMCDLEDEEILFRDLYEEVKYANAESRARKYIDDKCMTLELQDEGRSFYVSHVNGKLEIVAIYQDCPPCNYVFSVSRKELYTDENFRKSMLNYFVKEKNDEDLLSLSQWINGTLKEEPFNIYDLIQVAIACQCVVAVGYKDTPCEPDFKQEMNDLQKKMIAQIKKLCDQGMTLNVEVLCQNHSIGWEDGSFKSTDEIKDFFLKKSTAYLEWEYYYKDSTGEYNGPLAILNIETLYNIIESLQ